MKRSYEHIVIGAGALGSAAAYELVRAGARDVLVLEQFELGNTRGASEDHSRIIRHSYHSTNYTRLTHDMYEAWARLEDESGQQLVLRTGGLELAEAGTDGEAELNTYRSTLAPGVESETLDASEIRARWPQWRIGDETVGLYQPAGGILDIRRAGAVHRALARARGVDFLANTAVTELRSTPSHVVVETVAGAFEADSVIMCVASWATRLLPLLGVDWEITLSQEQVSYFTPRNLREFAPDRFPMWIWHGDPLFYGFPTYGEVATKIGRDMTGRWVTIDTRSYEPDADETALLRRFLERHLPGAAGPELYSKTCVYDMPADRDFILDTLPGHPRIVIGMGAGHAAKFAALIGEILAELALSGRSKHPIGAFRADRPALTDPDFPSAFRMVG